MEATWWTKPEQLDAKQKEILALDPDQNHLICGPPGSGKTNLLLLRAAYLYRNGAKNIAIIAYGRVLREFLATGTEHYPFAADKIKTYISWGLSVGRDRGLVPDGGKKSEAELRSIAKSYLQAALSDGSFDKYDYLLIDEAQDYEPEELKVILALANHVVIVGDDRQAIYQGSAGLEYLKEVVDSQSFLESHYRSGEKICRLADGIHKECDSENGMEAHANYNEEEFPSSVTPFAGLSLEDQAKQLISELKNQLLAYASGLIGVVCPRHDDLDIVIPILMGSELAKNIQIERFDSGYMQLDSAKRILVTTIHAAKGLEFRALHILAAEYVASFRDKQKRVTYTAVTRARTSLSIYHNRSLPAYFESALAAIEPPSDPTKIDDLFLSGPSP